MGRAGPQKPKIGNFSQSAGGRLNQLLGKTVRRNIF